MIRRKIKMAVVIDKLKYVFLFFFLSFLKIKNKGKNKKITHSHFPLLCIARTRQR